jgi:hypothetical protein
MHTCTHEPRLAQSSCIKCNYQAIGACRRKEHTVDSEQTVVAFGSFGYAEGIYDLARMAENGWGENTNFMLLSWKEGIARREDLIRISILPPDVVRTRKLIILA